MPAIGIGARKGRFRLPLSKGRPVGQQAFRPTGNTLSDPEKDVRALIEQAFATIPTPDPSIDPTGQDLAAYNRKTLAHFSQYADRLQALLAEQYLRSAQLAGKEIATLLAREFRRIGKAQTPPPSELIADWGFNQGNLPAQEWARAEAGNLITNMTREQQATFRQLVDQSYTLGRTPASTTRPLIDALNEVSPSSSSATMVRDLFGVNMNGLTVRYEQAVVNRAAKQAADLAERGITGTKAVERISRDTQKYAERLRRSRANTISRTEILRANNEGRLASFNQAVDQGLLSRQHSRKSWTVSPMDVCEICVPLDGQLQPLDQPFTNGTMTPPAHPNCRCSFDIEPNVELYQPPIVLGDGTPESPFRLGTGGEFTGTGRQFANQPLVSGKPVESTSRLSTSNQPFDELTDDDTRELIERQRSAGMTSERLPQYEEAIVQYTNGSGDYSTINTVLREPDYYESLSAPKRLRTSTYIQNLDEAIEQSPALDRPSVLYRGIKDEGVDAFRNLRVGDTITESGFASTSQLRSTAQTFARSEGIILEIEAPTGTKLINPLAYRTGDLAVHFREGYNEAEYLLARDTKFEVVSRRGNTIRLRIVDQPVPLDGAIIATPADFDAASDLARKASAVEPRITDDMIELTVKNNGTLEGTQFRLKETESLARKIAGDRLESGVSAIEASRGIKDSVRYTVILEPAEYGRRAQDMIDEIRASGKTVKVKNTWIRGADYNGINCQVFDPEIGQWYEVQFHTKASFDIKQGIHAIYEEARKATDPIVRERLEMEMISISSTQRFPVGASIVKRR